MRQQRRAYIMYLEDIQLSISRISEYIEGLDFASFKRDYKTVDAVIRNFEIIGEAAKNLPDFIKDKYPQMPWKEMYYLRNRVSHEYFGIDHEIIWDIISNNLPDNKRYLHKIIKQEREA